MTPSERERVHACPMGQKLRCVQALLAQKTRGLPQGLTEPRKLFECTLAQRVISGGETHVGQPRGGGRKITRSVLTRPGSIGSTFWPPQTSLPLLVCQAEPCDWNLQQAAGTQAGIARGHKKWRNKMSNSATCLCFHPSLYFISSVFFSMFPFLPPCSCNPFPTLESTVLSSLSKPLSSTFACALQVFSCFLLCVCALLACLPVPYP